MYNVITVDIQRFSFVLIRLHPLKEEGATRIKLGVSKMKVRKRIVKDHTHDIWVGDFEEGPYVMENIEVQPTYLCAFIDHYSR